MKISKRLQAIGDIACKYSLNGELADIGTDHGLLPCFCIKKEAFSYAYACDIAQGPLNQAKETIEQFNLNDKIETLLGNGLEPIAGKKLDTICICGMGGNLVCEILEANLKNCQFETLIVQANVNEVLVREWLNQNGYQIIDENIISDMGHFYEIIVARKGSQTLTDKELYLGPVLLMMHSRTFIEKLMWQKGIHEEILASLPESNPKYKRISQEYEWIKETIK